MIGTSGLLRYCRLFDDLGDFVAELAFHLCCIDRRYCEKISRAGIELFHHENTHARVIDLNALGIKSRRNAVVNIEPGQIGYHRTIFVLGWRNPLQSSRTDRAGGRNNR